MFRNRCLPRSTREKLSVARRRFLDHAPRSLVKSWHDLMTAQRRVAPLSAAATSATMAATVPRGVREGLPLPGEPLVAAWAAAFGRWMVYPSSCVQLQQHRFIVVCRSAPARDGFAETSPAKLVPMWPFVVSPYVSTQEMEGKTNGTNGVTLGSSKRRRHRHREGGEKQRQHDGDPHIPGSLGAREAQRTESRDLSGHAPEEVLSIVFPRVPLSDLCSHYHTFRLDTPHAVRIVRLEGGDTLETCTTVWFEWISSIATTPSSASPAPRSSSAFGMPAQFVSTSSSLSSSLFSLNAQQSAVRSVRLVPPTDVTRRFLRLPFEALGRSSSVSSWPGVIRELPIAFRWTPQPPPPRQPSLRVRGEGVTKATLHGVSVPSGSGLFLLTGLPSLLRLQLSNLVQAPCTALALWHQRSTLVAAARHASKLDVTTLRRDPSAAESPMLSTEAVMGIVLSTRRSFLMQGFCFCSNDGVEEVPGTAGVSGQFGRTRDSSLLASSEGAPLPAIHYRRRRGNGQRGNSQWETQVKADSPRLRGRRRPAVLSSAADRRKTGQRATRAARYRRLRCSVPDARRVVRQPIRRRCRKNRSRRRHRACARRRRPADRLVRRLAQVQRRFKSKMTKLLVARRREHRRVLVLEQRAERARLKQMKVVQRLVDRVTDVRRRWEVVSTLLRVTRLIRKGEQRT